MPTGRDDRIRTCDPHTPSVMRYQAALRPETSGGRPYKARVRRWQAPIVPIHAARSIAKGLHGSEEHTSELQSLMRISYAVFCLKKKQNTYTHPNTEQQHK